MIRARSGFFAAWIQPTSELSNSGTAAGMRRCPEGDLSPAGERHRAGEHPSVHPPDIVPLDCAPDTADQPFIGAFGNIGAPAGN